jgi:hypothetical protein
MSGLSQRMLARHGGLVAVICATHVFAACASAELLRISPSDDNYGRDFQRDGQFDMLGNPASEVLFVWISATIGEERAGFEFDLANVPHGAQIITAHFNASYQASGGPPGSRISWHGYAGDGVVSLDDLELSNVLANTSAFVGDYSIDVTPHLRSLHASGVPFAGFSIRAESEIQSTWVSSESSGFPSLRPRLELTFVVPEPGTALTLLTVLPLARRLSHRNRRASNSAAAGST